MAFQISKYGVVVRWTIYGAFFGFAAIVFLATMGDAERFYPWEGSEQIAFNIGRLLGGTVGGAFLFAIAAFLRKAITKED